MNWISASDRQQRQFLPECIEDYVRQDNPVRLIDAFVEALELRALGFVFPKENSQDRGRPAYPPGCLLKLYVYGYLQQIRSSRRLEAECSRNLEVIWLLGKLAPDFKTIADFRKNNAAAFKAVLRQFNEVCRQLDLFGGELIAIDGTKIKAQNAPSKNWSTTKLEKQLAGLDKHLEQYLQALEAADAQQASGAPSLSKAELAGKIEQIKDRKGSLQEKLQSLKQAGQTQVSATDPDSRSMKGAQGYVVGYNVQGAVDAKHHLLVETQVVNTAADQGQLAPMAQAVKEQLQLQESEVVADGGYFAGPDLKRCQEMGMKPYLASVNNSPSERAGLFGKADFSYDAAQDLYRCRAGQALARQRETLDKGRRLFYYDNPSACAQCPLKSRCTQAQYRTVSRWEHEECLERMAQEVAAHPEKLRRRKTLIEHCWGTLKWLLAGGFLLRGLVKVGAEVSLAHLGYNFKRALKVVGWQGLMAAFQA
jgi:transposase